MSQSIKITKVNESLSRVEGPQEELEKIVMFLRVERANAKFDRLVKLHIRDPYFYFTSKCPEGGIYVFNGHRALLKQFGIESVIEKTGILDSDIESFIKSLNLPFTPYDYQIKNIKMGLQNKKMLFRSCTSSGKSLTISVVLEWFRQHNLKGVLVVPNINLLNQFKGDIESYGLSELVKETQLLGNGNKSDFNTTLTITTWQSLIKYVDDLDKLNFDFIICDECHRFSSECTSDILIKSTRTAIKLGFTGTIPEDQEAKMMLLGLFGLPQTIITASQLIERNLGTPVNINAVMLKYPMEAKRTFREIPKDDFLGQLKFIKEYRPRTAVITKIVNAERSKGKNVLVLYQHTEHGEDIFEALGLDKDKAYDFEYQKASKVLFMNGSITGKVRELQRHFMEENTGIVMVANYSVMSTGANIKNLHSLILASPLKSFVTVSQSLGRLMRKHQSKTESNIFDLVDDFGIRKPSGIFVNQYRHRVSSSYIPEEFSIKEVEVSLD
jgi:superfamily II DNA or RNA helicase